MAEKLPALPKIFQVYRPSHPGAPENSLGFFRGTPENIKEWMNLGGNLSIVDLREMKIEEISEQRVVELRKAIDDLDRAKLNVESLKNG